MIDEELDECPLCRNVGKLNYHDGYIECPFCGNYRFDAMVDDLLTNCSDEFDDEQRLKVRYVIKKNNVENKNSKNKYYYELTETKIKEINKNYQIPKFMDKILLVLEYILDNTSYFEEYLIFNLSEMFTLFYCKHTTELFNIIQFLNSRGYIQVLNKNMLSSSYKGCRHKVEHYKYNYMVEIAAPSGGGYNYITYGIPKIYITSSGIEYVEKHKITSNNSKQAFVAMWFNRDENTDECKYDMQKVYEQAIEPAITSSKNKYNAMRIDCKEHCNDINDEMIAEIRKSKFLIADLTGYRGGVYFEAGFAYGLGIPVIYTCNKNWLNAAKDSVGKIIREGVHFDLSHRNMILWDYDNLDEFKNALRKRIEAVII